MTVRQVQTHVFTAARILRAVCFLSSLSGACGFANAATEGAPAPAVQNPASQSVFNNAPPKAATPLPAGAAKAVPAQTTKPQWTDLTPIQQQALAPLATEWDKLSSTRKSKWLAIGNKYASMKPDEQQRVQARMREWIKLTPEQRRVARESYARAKKLDPNQKTEHWQKYQELPEEQKKKLAEDAASRKHVATLPPASQTKSKTVPPIKSAPKPVLERSVTPQAVTQSGLQPSPQPTTK
jgi:hypothetical protein